MVMNRETYDRYSQALRDYNGIVEARAEGWQAYQSEADKIRALLKSAVVEVVESKENQDD